MAVGPPRGGKGYMPPPGVTSQICSSRSATVGHRPATHPDRNMLYRSSTRPVAALALALLVALTAAVRAAPGGRFLQIPNYISPFLGYAQASPVYNLPLKFLSNAKPVRILSGALDATPPFVSSGIVGHFPALSKVLRLPLKYVSNAKPMRVFFKKPFRFL